MMTSSSSSSNKWVKSALKNDTLVVELLLELKNSSPDSDSFKTTTKTIPTKDVITTTPSSRRILLPPPGWSNRRIRSKSSSSKDLHRGSPTTHLSWSGGGCSGSDGGISDLSYGARSIKANEGASTSSLKRKTFVDHEEGSLFKGRIHINKELTSTRVTLNQQVAATNENVKRIKVDSDQKPINRMGRMGEHSDPKPINRMGRMGEHSDPKPINKMGRLGEHQRQTKTPSLASKPVKISIRVEAKTEAPQREFVLPDLNMTPNEEDLVAMS